MGGSGSKRRSRAKQGLSQENSKSQRSLPQSAGLDEESRSHEQERTVSQLPDLDRFSSPEPSRNAPIRSPSLDVDDWLLELDRRDRMANCSSQGTSPLDDWQYPIPPPAYSEVDPLATASGHAGASAAMQGYVSIPNLMDVDVDNLDEVLQRGGRHSGAAFRSLSSGRQLSRESLSDDQEEWQNPKGGQRNKSRSDLASSNPNLVADFENKFKPKANGKFNERSNCEKPAALAKKKGFQSNPDIFASGSKLTIAGQGPRKQNNNRFQQRNQKSGWNSNGNQRRNKCITAKELTDLSGRSSQEIVFRVQNFSTGFVSLLHETEYSDEVLVLVMDILAKVCRNDDCPHTANALLQTALYTNLFNVRMVNYLQTAPYDGSMDDSPALLQNLLVVFTTVLREFKKEAEQKLGFCLTLGRQAIVQLIGPSGDLDDEYIQELRKLTDVQRLNSCETPAHSSAFPAVFNVNREPSPCAEPKTSTDYKHHLLQALQQEFVDTLRMECKDAGAPRLDVYRNVTIVGTDCTCDEGLVHELSFQTEGPEVSWSETTELLEGSTVFLSPNLQEELHCVMVVRRRPEDLSQGHVWVKLLDRKSTILQCARPLEMVENFTYWDDFISLMDALFLQMEYPLPFADHVLGAKKKLSHPRYLDGKSLFSFPSLPSTGKDGRKQFNALNVTTWPPAVAFGCNGPFHDAFKHALTKELALVHASSGAEAIRFGVCVLQTLLHNKAAWRSSQAAPVAVLFRTDEALDDFLRALLALSPQEKVIRMGAGRPDALLGNYDLGAARSIVCCTGDFPLYVMQNKRVLRDKMHKLKAEIAFKKELLEKARVRVLKSETLKRYIADHHQKQLLSLGGNRDAEPLLQWLSSTTILELQRLQKQQLVTAGKPKPGKKTRLRKGSDEKCESALAQMETCRRVPQFSKAGFDYSEKDFNQKPVLLNADNSFISQDQTTRHLKGKQFSLSDVAKLELERKDVMHASQVDNLLLLEAWDRWRLYRHWRSEFEKGIGRELTKLQEKYDKSFLQLQEVVREIDVSILRRATVVGVTTASAARHHRLFKMVAPRIVIVEEAGQISEASLIANLTEQCCHLIFIGDHRQLRPAANGFRTSDYANRPRAISLFEKLISKGIKHFSLSDNHLMSPSLQNVLKRLFVDLPFPQTDAFAPSDSAVRGMASDIFFINNSLPESVDDNPPCCYTNKNEAEYLALLARYLVKQGYAQAQITLLATSIGQVQLLIKFSKQNNLHQITCATVEDYQGKSNDIVLLSLVRSNEHGDVGVMADYNYMSVALTRARLGLYCIGNFKMLVDSLKGWKAHITFLAGQQLYGSTLTLKCGWHPTQTCKVDAWESLKVAISGICKQPCHTSLACGHKCTKECHAEDRDHKNVQCRHPCEKAVCRAGHKCPKLCFEKCPPCKMSFRIVRGCGHEAMSKCSDVQRETPCTEKCKKVLACGHTCPKPCGEKCDDMACAAINEYHDSPCRHRFFVSCAQIQTRALEKLCPMPCAEVLPCGHACTGTCGQCQQGRMHIPCKAKCEAVLICGHPCREACGTNCVPCMDACGSRCDHERCESVCGRPCVPCLKPCSWQCAHQKCSKMCFEQCDRTACNRSCPRLLPCKHPCIGFCGEPCPRLCRICDRVRILEGMPGAKQIGTARFVLLEDCNHVVEVTAMNRVMQGYGTVEVKTCPTCGAAIRRCLRFGNAIKKTLFDVCAIIQRCNDDDSGTGLSVQLRDIRNAIKVLPETMFPEAVQQLKMEVQRNLSSQELAVLENKYGFLQRMLSLWQANTLASSQDRLLVHQMLLNLKIAYLGLSSTSGQVVLDAFAFELKRATYLIHVFQLHNKYPGINANSKMLYSHLCNYLTDSKCFSAQAETLVVSQIKRLYLSCKIRGVHVEGIANVPMSDVQHFKAGHWTKCQNGHFSFSKRLVEGQQVRCQFCARNATH